MSISIDQLHPLVLNVGLAVHNADWNWKNVNSPFMRLYYVTEGKAQIELPTGSYTLKPNYMYIILPFTTHSYICDNHFCHYYIHIYDEYQPANEIYEEWNSPMEIKAREFDLTLFKRLYEINPHMSLPNATPTTYDNKPTLIESIKKNKQSPLYDQIESRGIIFQLLSEFMRHSIKKVKDKKDKRIEKTLSYIHSHIYENISLDELADSTCLSKDHFIRLFKQETGTTPLQYINQKKIEKAQLILVTDNMPVKNIAFTLGFDDYSYFNRLFKKLTGTTPQEYRHSYH